MKTVKIKIDDQLAKSLTFIAEQVLEPNRKQYKLKGSVESTALDAAIEYCIITYLGNLASGHTECECAFDHLLKKGCVEDNIRRAERGLSPMWQSESLRSMIDQLLHSDE